VALGFVLAIVIQGLVYPAVGIHTTSATELLIAIVFTVASLARSYIVRRAFETFRST
jgi:hypothetical protein